MSFSDSEMEKKPGAWNRLRSLPLFMLMAPLPTAMWVGLSHATMPIPEAIQTALYQAIAALVAWAAIAIAIRSMTQAAVLLAPAVMLWFSFGSMVNEPTVFQVVVWFAVAIAIGVAMMRKRWGREIVFLANVLTAAWLLQPAWLTASFVWSSTPSRGSPQQLTANVPKERLPHIVHIVLDGFPTSKVLRDVHGINNSSFTSSLERLGFKIIPDARSNYGHTLMSLASVFEMNTVQPLVAEMARKLDRQPAQLEGRVVRMMMSRRLQHSQVMQVLRASGYRYVAAETSFPRAIPGGADESWGPAESLCEFSFHQYATYKETPLVTLCEARARQSLIYSRHHTLLQGLANAPPVETGESRPISMSTFSRRMGHLSFWRTGAFPVTRRAGSWQTTGGSEFSASACTANGCRLWCSGLRQRSRVRSPKSPGARTAPSSS